MISLHRYRELFEVPQVHAALGASIVGRLPIGIAGLAILLFVQSRAQSFGLAGTASALYVLGLASIAPFLGRFMDRFGPRPILIACGLAYPAALAALAALVLSGAQAAAVGASAFVAGASLPPVSACIRALYPRLIERAELLQTAYSVDSAVVELVFIVGPAIVAACMAVGFPEAAIAIAALSAAIGSGVFARSPPVAQWMPARHERPKQRGALGKPGLTVVFATTVLYSIGFGLFEVGVTAHAAAMGAPSAAGIALALASVGSCAGAVVYGSRHWAMPLPKQFLAALVAMAAGMLLLVAIDHLVLYSLAAILAGVPMATVIATQSLLISRLATRERLAESFTWATTCLLGGVSAGIALGGWMAEGLAARWLLIAAAGSTAIAAAWVAAALKSDEKR
ncbi:MAG TPA: MFS transporter [Burkholderiales bacterium]|nr:MFS transporter [Burkholderiales bacterium]